MKLLLKNVNVVMWWNKKKYTVVVNVEKLHINLLTKRDTTYYIMIEGFHEKNNIFHSAIKVLWNRLSTHEYIKISDTKYLATSDIAEVSIQAREVLLITKQIKQKKHILK